jgi:hypothetical protein
LYLKSSSCLQIGNGRRVHFWEDVWLGSSCLAIQYWEIYCIVNEQNKTLAELLDVSNLKCIFRRCVDIRLFIMWEELISLMSTVSLVEEDDDLVWQFTSSGVYSAHRAAGALPPAPSRH